MNLSISTKTLSTSYYSLSYIKSWVVDLKSFTSKQQNSLDFSLYEVPRYRLSLGTISRKIFLNYNFVEMI